MTIADVAEAVVPLCVGLVMQVVSVAVKSLGVSPLPRLTTDVNGVPQTESIVRHLIYHSVAWLLIVIGISMAGYHSGRIKTGYAFLWTLASVAVIETGAWLTRHNIEKDNMITGREHERRMYLAAVRGMGVYFIGYLSIGLYLNLITDSFTGNYVLAASAQTAGFFFILGHHTKVYHFTEVLIFGAFMWMIGWIVIISAIIHAV